MPLAYYITDRHSSSLPILQHIQQAIDASVDLIQIREKDLATQPLLELSSRALELAKGSRSRVLVNDRVDVALAGNLDGVQLGHHSVKTDTVCKHLRETSLLIGASVHSMTEFLNAAANSASFVTLGPIFATPSKSAYGPPLGLKLLEQVCQRASMPVFALGGVGLENYRSCLSAGAAGVAAIRLFQTSESLHRAVRSIHDFLPDR
jgi:thiamine-phosphate pyrophosphorylase